MWVPAGAKFAALRDAVRTICQHGDTAYNPSLFDHAPAHARFFVIKSYSEDDVFTSIKKNVWTSTEHGNRRLNKAFIESQQAGCPVYLFFSTNGSGHFCGVAQMLSTVDFDKVSGIWAMDKWKGEFKIRWWYVKNVPNSLFKHILLPNNEMKAVTHSRDTQEVPLEQGRQTLSLIHAYKHSSSMLDDFERLEREDQYRRAAKQAKAGTAASATAPRAQPPHAVAAAAQRPSASSLPSSASWSAPSAPLARPAAPADAPKQQRR